MKQFSNVEKIIGLLMLLFAIGFNLWVYRLEPTAKIDPNDNAFQFALVDRTNQIWDFASKNCSGFFISRVTCHLSFLIDHWVPNWAEGYNLPYYYSHIPQIVIVGSWRLFTNLSRFIVLLFHGFTVFSNGIMQQWNNVSLFQYYHAVVYFLLSIFPLSVFLALRITGLSWVSAGFGALIASQISTDGFYGLDPSSFLWRGYGLSSQLFAMIWLPLAIAYAYRGKVVPAMLFLAATTAGHLGIGIMAFLSVGVVSLRKTLWIWAGALLLLAYWVIPAYLGSNYHNFSVWDPLWKFDSYGAKEVLTRLLNGTLFDFGRFPVLTILVFIGLFVNRNFALLFMFWIVMYFGRTTWGGLIDLIPFLKEFHQSRFIVGVHLAGLFLIPIGFQSVVDFLFVYLPAIAALRRWQAGLIIGLFVYLIITPQTLRYAGYNDFLIQRANNDYQKVESDVSLLLSSLRESLNSKPGRVFAGRGGAWGRDFRVAETPYYMHLSTYGIPVVLWLPETWSPSSDVEQYMNEARKEDYELFNIRYVVTPSGELVEPQPFWKLLKETPTWKLYEVETEGYFTTGVRPAVVSSNKENFMNLVHLWIQSDYPKQGLYPQLVLSSQLPQSPLPHFAMVDEVTYKTPDKKIHNLFSEIPTYQAMQQPAQPAGGFNNVTILSQQSDSDMVFRAQVDVQEGCSECIIILKQTFHPSWRATIDGEPVEPMIVFPFYTAVKLEKAGTHEILFSYQPSRMKSVLLFISAGTLLGMIIKRRGGSRQK